MKLTIEIKDDTFSYSFEIGKQKAAGDMPMNADSLVLFSNVLCACQRHEGHTQQSQTEELIAKAYLQDHPELFEVQK